MSFYQTGYSVFCPNVFYNVAFYIYSSIMRACFLLDEAYGLRGRMSIKKIVFSRFAGAETPKGRGISRSRPFGRKTLVQLEIDV